MHRSSSTVPSRSDRTVAPPVGFPSGRLARAVSGVLIVHLSACGGDGALVPEDDGPLVASVTISPGEATLSPGERTTLRARALDGRGVDITTDVTILWSSAAPEVVSVEPSGATATVLGLRDGAATIRARAQDKGGEATVTVVDPGRTPASIEIETRSTRPLDAGQAISLRAVVRNADGGPLETDVAWSSSKPHRFDVSREGVVTSVTGDGAAVIRAKVPGSRLADSVIVRSTAPAAVRIGLPVDTMGLVVGHPYVLPLNVWDAGGAHAIDRVTRVSIEDSTVVESVRSCNEQGWCFRITPGRRGTTRVTFGADDVVRDLVVKVTTPSHIEILGGDGRTGPPGRPIDVSKPTVRLVDAEGVGIAGHPVTVGVTSGGGRVMGGAQPGLGNHPMVTNTDGRGVYTFRWWLGPSVGSNTVTVAAPGATPATLTARAAEVESPFDIELEFTEDVSEELAATFRDAVDRFRSVIREALPPHRVGPPEGACGYPDLEPRTTTSVVVLVKFPPSQTGNSGGVCSYRPDGRSAVGVVLMHPAMLSEESETVHRFTYVITHEIAHALGLGSSPRWHQYVDGTHGFHGPAARAALEEEVRGAYRGPVPLTVGPGRDSHWSFEVVGPDVLTGGTWGSLDPAFSPWTAGALRDLGYVVDMSAADSWKGRFLLSEFGLTWRDVREGVLPGRGYAGH